MKKKVDTSKTRTVKIYKTEYFCDNCGKKLDKNNKKKTWTTLNTGGVHHGCLNNPKCNPFYKIHE